MRNRKVQRALKKMGEEKMSIVDEAFKILNTDEDGIDASWLNSDERYINFQNGLLDVRTMELKEHNPEILSTVRINARWEGAPSPTPHFDAYLDTLVNGDADTKTLLLEFIGAAISNVQGSRMKKALFMYGPGDSGKSLLKRLTEMLLGEGNFTGIDLQQMEARFGTSSIYGRRLAGSSDMSFMTVSELKIFKKATGGDALCAEFKGQDSFEFVYKGLLWFCMNELPKFGGDDGKWVYDRILPVYCPNVIPKSQQDAELLDKMYAERSGIVHKAVTAFKAVIDRGYRFTEPASSREIRADYQSENNSALEFFKLFMIPRTKPIASNDQFTVRKIYRITETHEGLFLQPVISVAGLAGQNHSRPFRHCEGGRHKAVQTMYNLHTKESREERTCRCHRTVSALCGS